MRLPRFRIRTLMLVVAIVAVLLVPIVACFGWLHVHDAWVSINGFTVRF